MELAKFKVCPECGKQNPPSLLECRYCEADLTGVRIVDRDAAAEGDVSSPESAPAGTELVRICDCGAENLPQARKCRACGEDISDILPRRVAKKASEAFCYGLTSVDGAFAVTIDQPAVVVGREAELREYLSDKVYVSRRHARFTVADGKVFVENFSGTNRTFVNNEEIPASTPTVLSDGDEIGLGGKVIDGHRQEKAAYFVFRVRP